MRDHAAWRWMGALVLGLGLPGCAAAAAGGDALRRCLDGFRDIAWQLPYAPIVRVRSCATASGSFNAQFRDGDAVLELMAAGPDFDLFHDHDASLDAVYGHLDWLFKRSGYAAGEVERSSSRSGSHVSAAAWHREDGYDRIELRMTMPYGNVWRITQRVRPKGGS